MSDWYCGRCGLHRDEHRLGAVAQGCVFEPVLRDPDATAARIAELEAQLAAARSALAACREVAGKRAGDDA